jgi:hypothetical protein
MIKSNMLLFIVYWKKRPGKPNKRFIYIIDPRTTGKTDFNIVKIKPSLWLKSTQKKPKRKDTPRSTSTKPIYYNHNLTTYKICI